MKPTLYRSQPACFIIDGQLLNSDDNPFTHQVNEVLRDIVPEGNGGESHAVLVQKEVRRFFRKHDSDGRGTVTEERFRSFCRSAVVIAILSSHVM